jgi:dihydrofolate reductase
MSDIVVFNSVTLDGVMQGPGRPDEDTRGGFQQGGWAVPYADPEMGKAAAESGTGALLLGRRTYEDFYGFWPHQTDNPFTEVLNRATKFVVSRTLEEPLPWENSVLLRGEAGESVARLKREQDRDTVVLGSGELVRTLLEHDLVDRFVLLIHPLVLGAGRRMFPDQGPTTKVRLLDTTTTSTGVIVATYAREEEEGS